MFIFGTPDFGASAFMGLILLVVGAVILLLAVIGFNVGTRMYRKGSKAGIALSLFSVLFPVFCYFGPSIIFRIEYGHFPLGAYPNGKIEKGMKPDEVQAILGSPQRRYSRNGEERWYYYLDSFGMFWFGVDFGPDGHVNTTYGN